MDAAPSLPRRPADPIELCAEILSALPIQSAAEQRSSLRLAGSRLLALAQPATPGQAHAKAQQR